VKKLIPLFLIPFSILSAEIQVPIWAEINGEPSQEERQLVDRYADYITKGRQTPLSDSDKLKMQEKGLLDRSLNYIFYKAENSNSEQYNFDPKTLYRGMLTDFFPEKDITSLEKYLSSSNFSFRGLSKSMQKSNNLKIAFRYSKMFLEDDLSQEGPKAEKKLYELAKDFDNEEKLKKKISSLYDRTQDGQLIFIDWEDEELSRFPSGLGNIFLKGHLRDKEGLSPLEIEQFFQKHVLKTEEKQVYNYLSPKNQFRSPYLGHYLNNRDKWIHLRKVLLNNHETDGEKAYEEIRSIMSKDCSFKNEEFRDQELLEGIKRLSAAALKTTEGSRGNKCSGLKDVFSNISSDIEKLERKADRIHKYAELRKQARNREQEEAPVELDPQSLKVTEIEKEIFSSQNSLASSISNFLNEGCEFKNGNTGILGVASRFTDLLGSNANRLSLNAETTLLLNTLGVVTSLSANIMKAFKGKTDREIGSSAIEQHKYMTNSLEQFCTFKSLLYNLDSLLANNPFLDQQFERGEFLAESDSTILQEKISCYENVLQESPKNENIYNINNLNLNNAIQCFQLFDDDTIPEDPEVKSFLDIYNQQCLSSQSERRPAICRMFEEGKKKITQNFDLCYQLENSVTKRIFDTIKSVLLNNLHKGDYGKILYALGQLKAKLAALEKSQNSLSLNRAGSQALQLTPDIKAYFKATGNILFSKDKESPINIIFENFKSDIKDYNDFLDTALDQNENKTSLKKCEMAKQGVVSYQGLFERYHQMKTLCNSFNADKRVPFKSEAINTYTYIKDKNYESFVSKCQKSLKNAYKDTKTAAGRFDKIDKILESCDDRDMGISN
jgi:hypothetical protein